MINTIRIAFVIMSFLFLGCSVAKKTQEQENPVLTSLVNEQNFKIESEWAYPLNTRAYTIVANSGLIPPGSNAGQINLIGNANYLQIKGDSVSAVLSYFGERQMGGGYGNRGAAIRFDGIPNNFEISEHKKGGYAISFSINDSENTSENYKIFLRLFNSMNASISVNSSQRFNIRYSGNLKEIEGNN